jgi:hypothetical protein
MASKKNWILSPNRQWCGPARSYGIEMQSTDMPSKAAGCYQLIDKIVSEGGREGLYTDVTSLCISRTALHWAPAGDHSTDIYITKGFLPRRRTPFKSLRPTNIFSFSFSLWFGSY